MSRPPALAAATAVPAYPVLLTPRRRLGQSGGSRNGLHSCGFDRAAREAPIDGVCVSGGAIPLVNGQMEELRLWWVLVLHRCMISAVARQENEGQIGTRALAPRTDTVQLSFLLLQRRGDARIAGTVLTSNIYLPCIFPRQLTLCRQPISTRRHRAVVASDGAVPTRCQRNVLFVCSPWRSTQYTYDFDNAPPQCQYK